MTIFMDQVYDEALRCAYALSTGDLGDLLVGGGLMALIAAFGLTARRLRSAPRTERRDRPCHL